MKLPRRINWKAVFLLGAAGTVIAAWPWLNPRHSERVDIRSRALHEKRFLLVHLPPGYGSGKDSYPLLVLLDGGDQKQFSGEKTLYSRSKEVLARFESEGLPPLILVGIGNRDRVRDMTPIQRPDIYAGGGGALKFIEFIETEVLPFVTKRWRIGQTRILYGESYGGLFVLHALARGRQAFSDYIAVSPAVGVWPKGLGDSFRRRFSSPSRVRSLYVVYGENDAPLVTGYTLPFLREIDAILPGTLKRRLAILPGEGHNPPGSLELGLRFLFSADSAPPAGDGERLGFLKAGKGDTKKTWHHPQNEEPR